MSATTPPGERGVEGAFTGTPGYLADVDNYRGVYSIDLAFGDAPSHTPATETGFESASCKIWKLYESVADKHDTELADKWKGETDTMLIFVRPPPLMLMNPRQKPLTQS
jgi:hypothetical protein